MGQDKLQDRIRKLLQLAGSANEHEAALAMEKAAALMREHGISKEDVSDSPFAGRPEFEEICRHVRRLWRRITGRINCQMVREGPDLRPVLPLSGGPTTTPASTGSANQVVR